MSTLSRRGIIIPDEDSDWGPLFSGFRIGVCDDEESILDLVRAVVAKRLKCEVLQVQSGDELVDLVEKGNIDVVVTDMKMPGLHGVPLVERLCETDANLRIICMTGYPLDFPYVDVIHAGVDDFINKPFSTGELEGKLIRLFIEIEVERERKVADQKYRGLFEMSAEGMVQLGYPEGVIVEANSAFGEMIGHETADLVSRNLTEFLTGNAGMRMEQWLKVCAIRGHGTLADVTLTQGENEEQEIHADVSANILPLEGSEEFVVFLAFRDITEKRQVDLKLAEAAQKDGMTGLFNKQSFNRHIEGAIASARQMTTPLCLLMIDLDNFKQCNDNYGHQIGDKILVSVAEAIKKSIRIDRTDMGYRLGGDEFTVLLECTEAKGAKHVAERIQAEFASGECYGTSMSIGVSQYSNPQTSEEFIHITDGALYKAKDAGKNTVEVV